MYKQFTRIFAVLFGISTIFLFISSVLMMNYNLFFGLQKGILKLDGYTRILVNIILLLQFPVVHSLLLTKLKRIFYFNTEVGKKIYTTTYVFIASFQLLLTFVLWSPSNELIYQSTNCFHYLLFLLSNLILAKAMFDAGLSLQLGYLGWLSVYKDRQPEFPDMPIKGLYKICRQPIYLGFTLVLWTPPNISYDSIFLAICWTIYCYFAPFLKEKRYSQIYGTKFQEFKKRVPYFIPNIIKK